MQTWEELRDLADKMDKLAREHPAHPMIYDVTRVFVNHIRAEARVREISAILYKDKPT